MPRPSPHRQGGAVEPAGDGSTVMSLASSESRPAPAPESTNPISRVGSTVAKWIGIGGDNKKPVVVTVPPKPRPVSVATHKPLPAQKPVPVVAAQPKPETATKQASREASTSSTTANLLTGAAPVVPADTFESRWAPAR